MHSFNDFIAGMKGLGFIGFEMSVIALAVWLVWTLLEERHIYVRLAARTLQKVERFCWWVLGCKRGPVSRMFNASVWNRAPHTRSKAWYAMKRLDVRQYHRLAASVGETCTKCMLADDMVYDYRLHGL